MSKIKVSELDSIVRGAGSTMCLHTRRKSISKGITFYTYKPNNSLREAIISDWSRVGNTIAYFTSVESSNYDKEEKR